MSLDLTPQPQCICPADGTREAADYCPECKHHDTWGAFVFLLERI